jgi:hypothetical protein
MNGRLARGGNGRKKEKALTQRKRGGGTEDAEQDEEVKS